jgi:hypothetical protein
MITALGVQLDVSPIGDMLTPADIAGLRQVLDVEPQQARAAVAVIEGIDPLAYVPETKVAEIRDEITACRRFEWHAACIPGDWQSVLFTGTQRRHYWLARDEQPPAGDLATHMRGRLLRRAAQQRADRDVHLVLGEQALHVAATQFGHAVVCDQIRHFLRLCEAHDHLQLLPAEETTHLTDFAIMEFDDTTHNRVSINHGATSAFDDDIAVWWKNAQDLRVLALGPRATCARLRELLEAYAPVGTTKTFRASGPLATI